jgi:prolyl-tRNA synthetase
VRKVIQQRFGGLTEKMGTSWQGVVSTFQSTWDTILERIGAAKMGNGESLFDLMKRRVKGLTDLIVDENGELRNPVMGCYGIGVGRLLACVLENHHDEFGPIWPKAVAPWQLHICMLNNARPEVRETGFSLYEELAKTYEVVIDDRDVAAGVQFADADLLGVPLRIIVSPRNLASGQVEIVSRDKSVRELVNLNDADASVGRLMEQIR